MDAKTDYSGLIQRIGRAEFEKYYQFLSDQADKFIEAAGYQKSVKCNERIMIHVLLDYYSDIERLKEFHGIEHVRTTKIFAYTAYWILRRKPLQFYGDTIEEKDIFVNERFALYLMINECLMDGVSLALKSEMQNKFDEYIEYLLYYFKYRDCNAQVLELMVETFKMGVEFQKRP